jgi:quinol monooxygenase YgiN
MSTTRINTFRAKHGMANNLREFLISIIPLIDQSQGCESCQLLQSQDNANEFVVIEVWASVSAHQASLKNVPPEKFSVILPMLAIPPSGSYFAAQACSRAAQPGSR